MLEEKNFEEAERLCDSFRDLCAGQDGRAVLIASCKICAASIAAMMNTIKNDTLKDFCLEFVIEMIAEMDAAAKERGKG